MEDLLTVRQLQDLLQVDRVTIYRMLHDGRLRGFKVGGQWRFSSREIEAWLSGQSRLVSAPPVPQPLPLACAQAIQDICAEAMEVALVTVGLDGGPLTEISNGCAFCRLVLSSERRRRRCAEAWLREPYGQFHTCHAGLLVTGAPVEVAGRPVAVVAACQAVLPPADSGEPAPQSRLALLAADLGLSEAELRAAAEGVRRVQPEDLPRLARLTQRLAGTFSEIAQERLSLLGRLEKIAEMSRV